MQTKDGPANRKSTCGSIFSELPTLKAITLEYNLKSYKCIHLTNTHQYSEAPITIQLNG